MIITTANDIPGYRITLVKGLVRGLVVRSPTISQGFLGGLKQIVGGNISAYKEMCEQARREAVDDMVVHAVEMGANSIVGFRYDATEIGGQHVSTEVLAYGTAVFAEKL